MTVSGLQKVHAVLGGFHLAPRNEDYVRQTIKGLVDLDVDHIIPMHCTGEPFYEILKAEAEEGDPVLHRHQARVRRLKAAAVFRPPQVPIARGTRHRGSSDTARPRRRGDRVRSQGCGDVTVASEPGQRLGLHGAAASRGRYLSKQNCAACLTAMSAPGGSRHATAKEVVGKTPKRACGDSTRSGKSLGIPRKLAIRQPYCRGSAL